jgi:hypothetical protein
MGKLCTDGSTSLTTSQLIGKLVALLQEADYHKFDEAVAKAKKQLTTEAKQARREDLEKLFDGQIATLKDRGTPEQIVELLANQRSSVIDKASEMTFENGHVPFLPVIPLTYRGLYDLMSMVNNKGKAGYTYPNPTTNTDKVETPDEPYYIYDVEDGESTRSKSPESAEKAFKSQKRSPLTLAETMALTTHTDVLSRHYVWAAGSRCALADEVPNVCLYGDRPRLYWSYADISDSGWGSASCGSR